MKVLIIGLPFEPDQSGDTPEHQARNEAEALYGTSDDCLVVDAGGLVMLNTTRIVIDNVQDGYVDAT